MRVGAFTAVALATSTAAVAMQGTVHKPGDPGVQPPAVVKEIKPFYTPWAMHHRIEGTVLLQAVIDTKGRPRRITVTRSLERGLDRRAADAFDKWRFTPATKDGKPVDYLLEASMTFDLRGGHRGPVYLLPSPDVVNPDVLKDVKPRFPGFTGAIKLEGIVETDGSVSSVRILETTHPNLNDAGMEAFLATKFKPAMRAGVPVAVRVEMEYTFQVR